MFDLGEKGVPIGLTQMWMSTTHLGNDEPSHSSRGTPIPRAIQVSKPTDRFIQVINIDATLPIRLKRADRACIQWSSGPKLQEAQGLEAS
jgi:hypothetical protein